MEGNNTYLPIGGSRPFAGLMVPAGGIDRPTHPQTPYGTELSKDRNGVFLRIGDRVKNHAEKGVTFLIVGVFCDVAMGLGDTTDKSDADDEDPAGWLDVFVAISCVDCEIVGHVEHFAAELKRIERESADLQRRSKAGRL